VRYERDGPVAVLTIDHPPVNVLSASVLEALTAALTRALGDLEARVVVLRGAAERAFAAGADIREMAPMGPTEARLHGGRGQSTTRAIELLPLPVIAAVHGSCLGGGCEIALACDFIVASDDATFGQPEINLGVMPGWGGTRRLPRRVGMARARSWIMTGRPVTAQVAFDQGLVHRVVPRAELLSASVALARELAQKPATALAAAKFALLNAADPGIDAGLRYELDLWSELFGTPDQRSGMASFLEKRAPTSALRLPWEELEGRFPYPPDREAGGADGPKSLTREKRKT
jgi:enoyl-CoA hydratase/carnithine racemase